MALPRAVKESIGFGHRVLVERVVPGSRLAIAA